MKKNLDKIGTGLLVAAFIILLISTFDKDSNSSRDPWLLPVLAANILSLNWA